jgi:hypothetical protein
MARAAARPRSGAAARPRSGAAVLPAVNTLVRLTIGRCAGSDSGPDAGSDSGPDAGPVAANVPSRIEDVIEPAPAGKGFGRGGGTVPTQVFVALPHYRGDVDVPRPGTACTVTWVSSDGLYDLPTGFVERVSVGPVVYAWRLDVTGAARRAQRRRYVRASWTRPVVVDVIPVARLHQDGSAVGGEDGSVAEELSCAGGTVHGITLDLSEGGIRCLLPPPPLRTGQPVRAHLEVEGERLALEGTVVRVAGRAGREGREGRGDTRGAGPQNEIGIAFTEPDEHGDLLRRVVFGEQLRSRRSRIR